MMEQPAYHYLRLFLVLLLLPLLLLNLLRKRSGSGDGLRLPPGPWRLPVIGSLHHLVGSPLVHRVLADLTLRLEAPLMYLKLGQEHVVVATSPEAVREIMQTSHHAIFTTRPWSPTIRIIDNDGRALTFAPYDALWRRLRRIFILDLLSRNPYRIKSFCYVGEDDVWRFVAAIQATPSVEPVNVSEQIAALFTGSALRIMIGGKFRRSEDFLRVLEEAPKLIAGFNLDDMFPSSWLVSLMHSTARLAKRSHQKSFELMAYVVEHLEERRGAAMSCNYYDMEEKEDLEDVLLRIHEDGGDDGPLAMGMIKAVILDLYGAGRETSATTVQWAMSELMRHPNVMQKAQAEVRNHLQGEPNVTQDGFANLKYLRLVIKETLRLHPPAPLLVPRKAIMPFKILGYDIPKGTTVLVNAWAVGRDPRHWEDPEEFMPERLESCIIDFDDEAVFEHIPSTSLLTFAHASMEIVLATLLYHFDWELPGGVQPEELDMTEELGLTLRRKNDLYLHARVHVPVPPVLWPRFDMHFVERGGGGGGGGGPMKY